MKPKRRTNPKATRSVTIKVVGVSFANADGSSRQHWIELYGRLGAPVHLEREPQNPHSEGGNATAIYVAGKQIGYVPETMSAWIAEYLDREYEWTARVLEVTGGIKEGQTLGMLVEAAFWKNIPRPANPYREGYENQIEKEVSRGLRPNPYDVRGRDANAPRYKSSLFGALIFAFLTLAALVVFALRRR